MIQEIEMGSFIRIENYQMEDLPVDERSGALFEIKMGCQERREFCFWYFL